jgi:hypothetical protein
MVDARNGKLLEVLGGVENFSGSNIKDPRLGYQIARH